MVKKFIKTVEDFTCGHCGRKVTGSGYTNHCPECLWSQHVDVNPGDRLATCRSLMEPVSLVIEKHEQIITHRCVVCGHTKRNKMSPQDNQDAIIQLSSKHR